jgi:CRISPR type I-E-associated protein CasB/Cse2
MWVTTAAGFAIHQRTSDAGNMGTTMRALATGEGRGEDGLATFDARFRRLLACAGSTEVCDHLTGILRAAERNGIAINFVQLLLDLQSWGERVKVQWATEYWGHPSREEAVAGPEHEDAGMDSEVGEEESQGDEE